MDDGSKFLWMGGGVVALISVVVMIASLVSPPAKMSGEQTTADGTAAQPVPYKISDLESFWLAGVPQNGSDGDRRLCLPAVQFTLKNVSDRPIENAEFRLTVLDTVAKTTYAGGMQYFYSEFGGGSLPPGYSRKILVYGSHGYFMEGGWCLDRMPDESLVASVRAKIGDAEDVSLGDHKVTPESHPYLGDWPS